MKQHRLDTEATAAEAVLGISHARQPMKATGWSCGNITQSGAGLGIRISHADRDTHFDRSWGSVTVAADGREIEVPISSSFWRRCSELRSREIGRFLLSRGLAPWRKGEPPTLELVPEGEGRFRLLIPGRANATSAPPSVHQPSAGS